jgi:hypothetical protein
VIKNSIQFGVASVHHEPPGYRSGQQAFGTGMKYALISTVVIHKTTTGNALPQLAASPAISAAD